MDIRLLNRFMPKTNKTNNTRLNLKAPKITETRTVRRDPSSASYSRYVFFMKLLLPSDSTRISGFNISLATDYN